MPGNICRFVPPSQRNLEDPSPELVESKSSSNSKNQSSHPSLSRLVRPDHLRDSQTSCARDQLNQKVNKPPNVRHSRPTCRAKGFSRVCPSGVVLLFFFGVPREHTCSPACLDARKKEFEKRSVQIFWRLKIGAPEGFSFCFFFFMTFSARGKKVHWHGERLMIFYSGVGGSCAKILSLH